MERDTGDRSRRQSLIIRNLFFKVSWKNVVLRYLHGIGGRNGTEKINCSLQWMPIRSYRGVSDDQESPSMQVQSQRAGLVQPGRFVGTCP
jgi:hypothetical protein